MRNGFILIALLATVLAGCSGDPVQRGLVKVAGLPDRTPNAFWVDPLPGGFAVFPAGREEPDARFPPNFVDDQTRAIAPDGRGGWIVGGSFKTVGGRRCPRLARITQSGKIDPRFCLAPNAAVWSLAVGANTVYVGGEFTRIGGKRRLRLAAIDSRSGSLRPWQASVTGRPLRGPTYLDPPYVAALALAGDSVFLGGFFEHVGGVPRGNLAAVDANSGRLRAWRADAGVFGSAVRALMAGKGRLYVAGVFLRLGARQVRGLGALDLRNATPTAWQPRVRGGDESVQALAIRKGRVYLGGRFTRVSGVPRVGVAAVDARTGAVVAGFRPPPITPVSGDFGVQALTLAGGRLYVGGGFSRAGGVPHEGLAAVDARTGCLLPWTAHVSGTVDVLATTGLALSVGGWLNHL